MCNSLKIRKELMKLLKVLWPITIALCICNTQGSGKAGDVENYTEYELVLVFLEHGFVNIESYPITHDMPYVLQRDRTTRIYSLNLTDTKGIYGTLLCNDSTKGAIVVRAHNDLLCDYCLNWGAMLGVQIDCAHDVIVIPVECENKNIKISVPVRQKFLTIVIQSSTEFQQICALMMPSNIVKSMHKTRFAMSLADACRLAIVVPTNRAKQFANQPSFAQELEFDRILDEMTKDGTISIKPVSPCKIWLKSIGSAFFVKYIALRAKLQAWWNYFRFGRV